MNIYLTSFSSKLKKSDFVPGLEALQPTTVVNWFDTFIVSILFVSGNNNWGLYCHTSVIWESITDTVSAVLL